MILVHTSCSNTLGGLTAYYSAAKMQHDTMQFEDVAEVGLAQMIGLSNIRTRLLRLAGAGDQPENPS